LCVASSKQALSESSQASLAKVISARSGVARTASARHHPRPCRSPHIFDHEGPLAKHTCHIEPCCHGLFGMVAIVFRPVHMVLSRKNDR
jgi:hypothetical protein